MPEPTAVGSPPAGHTRRQPARRRAALLSAVPLLLAAAGVLWLPAACLAQDRAGAAVEFELPNPELRLLQEKANISFIVGYFAEGSSEPLFSYPADDAAITPNGRVRLPLRQWSAPDGQQVVVRVRTVTAGGQSVWSEPSEAVGAARLAGRGDRGATRAERRAERRAARDAKAAAALADQLRTNTALVSALAGRFPGVDIVEAGQGYLNLRTFVAALDASFRLQIPFADVKPLTLSRDRSSLEAAIRKLRPDVDAAAEARKSFEEAAAIIKSSQPARQRGTA